jgi:Fe-S cluster biogenesis protein NfuA
METLEKTAPTSELYPRIERALESIRSYLQADGGDLRIHAITPDHVLEIELLGACITCSMSDMTLKLGIEQAVKTAVPEIQKVVAVPSIS